jgi:polyhydroxyalkanoate synthesis regulator phasin
MEPLLKKSILAGLGLISLTKEKIEEVVDDLVKRGELSKDESSKFVKEVMEKADQRTKEMKEWVDKRVDEAMSKIRPKALGQIEEISAKLEQLSAEVKKLQKELSKKTENR